MVAEPSIFAHHLLPVTKFSRELVLRPAVWPTILICLCVLLLTIMMVAYRRKVTLLVQSLFSQRFMSLLLREGKILEERVFIVSLIYDLLTFALALQLLIVHFFPNLLNHIPYIAVYGILFVGLIVLYFSKFLSNLIYSALFDYQDERYQMNLYKFIFLTVSAVFLLPFLIFAQFTGYFSLIYIFIPIFIVFFVFFLYRLIILNPRKINLFQFFIYFCTLEILPYLVLVKSLVTLCK